MEYLKPIEQLEQTIKRYQIILWSLTAIIALILIFVPDAVRKNSPVVVQTNDSMVLSDVSPLETSQKRYEQFTKAYLAARFFWSQESVKGQTLKLKAMTTDQVYAKLIPSVAASDSLATLQNAKSYFVLEDFSISSGQSKIEVFATRVLRIKNASIATPIRILLTYQNTEVSKSNPYGLMVSALNETELPLEAK